MISLEHPDYSKKQQYEHLSNIIFIFFLPLLPKFGVEVGKQTYFYLILTMICLMALMQILLTRKLLLFTLQQKLYRRKIGIGNKQKKIELLIPRITNFLRLTNNSKQVTKEIYLYPYLYAIHSILFVNRKCNMIHYIQFFLPQFQCPFQRNPWIANIKV